MRPALGGPPPPKASPTGLLVPPSTGSGRPHVCHGFQVLGSEMLHKDLGSEMDVGLKATLETPCDAATLENSRSAMKKSSAGVRDGATVDSRQGLRVFALAGSSRREAQRGSEKLLFQMESAMECGWVQPLGSLNHPTSGLQRQILGGGVIDVGVRVNGDEIAGDGSTQAPSQEVGQVFVRMPQSENSAPKSLVPSLEEAPEGADHVFDGMPQTSQRRGTHPTLQEASRASLELLLTEVRAATRASGSRTGTTPLLHGVGWLVDGECGKERMEEAEARFETLLQVNDTQCVRMLENFWEISRRLGSLDGEVDKVFDGLSNLDRPVEIKSGISPVGLVGFGSLWEAIGGMLDDKARARSKITVNQMLKSSICYPVCVSLLVKLELLSFRVTEKMKVLMHSVASVHQSSSVGTQGNVQSSVEVVAGEFTTDGRAEACVEYADGYVQVREVVSSAGGELEAGESAGGFAPENLDMCSSGGLVESAAGGLVPETGVDGLKENLGADLVIIDVGVENRIDCVDGLKEKLGADLVSIDVGVENRIDYINGDSSDKENGDVRRPVVGIFQRENEQLAQRSQQTKGESQVFDEKSEPASNSVAEINRLLAADQGMVASAQSLRWLAGSSGSDPETISWARVVSGGAGKEIEVSKAQFFEPSVIEGIKVAMCPTEEMRRNAQKWESSLVGYVVGRRPYFMHLRKAVERLWKPTGKMEVFSRDNGFFIFRFDSKDDCVRVMDSGPWYIDGKLLLVKQWKSGLKSETELFSKIPIWVRFPNLPLDWWSVASISRMASVIGKPIKVDIATRSENRLGYARCCIEIGIEDDFPDSVMIQDGTDEASRRSQQVIYEEKPLKCGACVSFGHLVAHCPWSSDKAPSKQSFQRKVWRPKASPSLFLDPVLAPRQRTIHPTIAGISGIVGGSPVNKVTNLASAMGCSNQFGPLALVGEGSLSTVIVEEELQKSQMQGMTKRFEGLDPLMEQVDHAHYSGLKGGGTGSNASAGSGLGQLLTQAGLVVREPEGGGAGAVVSEGGSLGQPSNKSGLAPSGGQSRFEYLEPVLLQESIAQQTLGPVVQGDEHPKNSKSMQGKLWGDLESAEVSSKSEEESSEVRDSVRVPRDRAQEQAKRLQKELRNLEGAFSRSHGKRPRRKRNR